MNEIKQASKRVIGVDSLRQFRRSFNGIAYARGHLDRPLEFILFKSPNSITCRPDLEQAGVEKGTDAGFISIGWENGLIQNVKICYYTAPFGEQERWVIKNSGQLVVERDFTSQNGYRHLTYSYNNKSSNVRQTLQQIEEMTKNLIAGRDVYSDLYLPVH